MNFMKLHFFSKTHPILGHIAVAGTVHSGQIDFGRSWNHFQKYIDNQLNPNETLETSFIDSLTETANTFWGTLSDRNVIAEGVFGAISGAVGGVNFNTNLNSNTKGFKDKIPITWNAPFVSEIR